MEGDPNQTSIIDVDMADGNGDETTESRPTFVDSHCFPWSKKSEDSIEKFHDNEPIVHPTDIYNTCHNQRGHALVINQEKFSYRLRAQGYNDRAGSDVDGKNIRRALNKLGFEVSYHSNITAASIRRLCKKMAERDHTDCDSFVCVILSHGEEGIVFGTDEEVKIKEIANYFTENNCRTLVGKPKLFFIQACRGSDTDAGVEINVTDAKVDMQHDSITLPVYTDFLFAYSTVPGYYSWRNGQNGSWFIQALCDNIEKYGNVLELQKLLIRVNRDVAQKFQSYNPGNKFFHQKKQASCAMSMLTRDVYFTNKS